MRRQNLLQDRDMEVHNSTMMKKTKEISVARQVAIVICALLLLFTIFIVMFDVPVTSQPCTNSTAVMDTCFNTPVGKLRMIHIAVGWLVLSITLLFLIGREGDD